MKTIFVIAFLFISVNAFAQTGGVAVKKSSSSRIYTLPFPHDTSKYLRGDSSWATVSGGTANTWYVGDASTTPVQAPSVTAGTKGLAAGDTASVTGYGGIAFGDQTLASGQGSVAIGSKTFTFLTQAVAKGTIAVGTAAQANSTGTVAYGADAIDGCTYTGNSFLGGGSNVLVGESANTNPGGAWDGVSFGGTTAAKASFNTCTGFSSSATGSLNSTYGDGAQITGMASVMLGNNVGTNFTGTRICDIGLGYGLDANLTCAFDSCALFGAGFLTARNTGAFYWGTGNTTTTGLLACFSDGNKDGNASTFDCLRISKTGVITAGNSFVAGAALGAATTPASGAIYQDNGIIAWGDVASGGTVNSQFGNTVVAKTGTGTYTITLPVTPTKAICAVTLQGSTLGLSATSSLSGAVFTVKTGVGAVATDETFNFIITGRP